MSRGQYSYSDIGHIPLRTYDPSDQNSNQGPGKTALQQSQIDDTIIEQDLLDLEAYCQRPTHKVLGIDVTYITSRLPSSIQVTNECLNKSVAWGAAAVAFLLIVIFIAAGSSSSRGKRMVDAAGGNLCAWTHVYLPNSIAPDSYDLTLKIDFASLQVTGNVDIMLNVSSATKCVVLHADGLHITSAKLQHSGTLVTGRVSKPNRELQQVAVQFNEALKASDGDYTLQLEFQYPLQDGVDGLYRSSFKDAAGKDSFLAVSQFESIAARKAFPCFDEPRFKAKFTVALETPPGVALSNMPKNTESPIEGGMVRHTFDDTPYMSTYLVAFLVGNLTNSTQTCPTKQGDILISAWGTYDRRDQLGTAAQVACKAVKKMENMTGVAYALPKLDLAAIPDFAAGAMENWGLITYKETDILVDVLGDDAEQRFQVASTVAHEVAHQWFGNLVTASDWTELWLNEGFATYFENIGGNAFEPHYRYFDFFYKSITSEALNDDAMSSSHPLTMSPVKSLGQIDNLFDSIMYEKGAAVLRMLRAYLNRDRMANTGGQLRRRLLAHLHAENTTNTASTTSTTSVGPSPATNRTAAGAPAPQNATDGSDFRTHHTPVEETGDQQTGDQQTGDQVTGDQETGDQDAGDEDSGADDGEDPDDAGDAGGSDKDGNDGDGSDFGDEDDERSPHDPADDEEEDPDFFVEDPSTDPFLKGLAEYLQRRQYNSSTYKDLWGSMEFAVGEPVMEWMSTWTLRKNYPLVTLEVSDQGDLMARQEPFTTDAPLPKKKGAAPILPAHCDEKQAMGTWWVPLAWRMQQGESAVNWHPFSTCNTSLGTKMDLKQGGYVLLNSGRFGFFRVNYPKNMWKALATAAALDPANPDYIDFGDFSGLLDDSFRLSEAGLVDITVFMELASALGKRLEAWAYSPWALASKQLHKVRLLMAAAQEKKVEGTDCLADLQQWMLKDVTGPYIANTQLPGQAQGFSFNITPNEFVTVRRLRPLLLSTAAEFGDTSQWAAAVEMLQAISQRGKGAVHPDLHSTVFKLAVQSGKVEAFDMVLDLYKKETDAEEKNRLMMALTFAPTAPLITRALKLASSPDIRLADMGKFVASLGQQSRLAFTMTWDYILSNTQDFLKRYPGGGAGTEAAYSFGRPLKDLGALFVDEKQLRRLSKWAKKYQHILDPKFIPYVEENIRQNDMWLRKQGAAVCSWLKAQKH